MRIIAPLTEISVYSEVSTSEFDSFITRWVGTFQCDMEELKMYISGALHLTLLQTATKCKSEVPH